MDNDLKNWFQQQQSASIENDFKIKDGRIYYRDELVDTLTTNWPIVRVNGKVIPNKQLKYLDMALKDNGMDDLRTKIRPYIHRVEYHEYNF